MELPESGAAHAHRLGMEIIEEEPAGVRYHTAMEKIPARYPMPEALSLAQLEQFLAQQGDRYAVRWLAEAADQTGPVVAAH